MNVSSIIQKIWNYCTVLRDDGLSYGDYLEQLTYLLFIKVADEYSKPPYNRETNIPEKYNWKSLTKISGSDLEVHYVDLLLNLGKAKAY